VCHDAFVKLGVLVNFVNLRRVPVVSYGRSFVRAVGSVGSAVAIVPVRESGLMRSLPLADLGEADPSVQRRPAAFFP
jgi:hypothetical protein